MVNLNIYSSLTLLIAFVHAQSPPLSDCETMYSNYAEIVENCAGREGCLCGADESSLFLTIAESCGAFLETIGVTSTSIDSAISSLEAHCETFGTPISGDSNVSFGNGNTPTDRDVAILPQPTPPSNRNILMSRNSIFLIPQDQGAWFNRNSPNSAYSPFATANTYFLVVLGWLFIMI